MLVTPSFDDVQDEVTPGEYHVQVTGASTGEWRTGTKYSNWELETVNEADPKNNGRRVWHKTPVEGKGVFLLQRFYRAATKQVLGGDFRTEDLIGTQLKVVLADGLTKEGSLSGYTEIKAVKSV